MPVCVTRLLVWEKVGRLHQGPNLQNIVRQIYGNVTTYGKFTTNLQKFVRQSYHKSYDKMYDSSLAVVRQHQALMQ